MCENQDLLTIIGIAKKVLTILQIAIPIALLIFGTLDLGKAVMAGEDKEPWRRRIDDCLQAFRDTNIDGITY